MKKEDKDIVISQIKETVASYSHFYLTEAQGLNAEQVSKLRRLCNKREVKMLVVKNTLFRKALESLDVDYSPIYDSLKNNHPHQILFPTTIDSRM